MPTAARAKTIYVCGQCGASSPKWMGRCPSCGEWNTLVEEPVRAAGGAVRRSGIAAASELRPRPLGEVTSEHVNRISTGIIEFDRVLGGGLVPGGVVLLGGDPGVGKSTLVLQMLAELAQRERTALYVTGEESAAQIALRGQRLDATGMNGVRVFAATDLHEVEAVLQAERPEVAVIDSVQTVRSSALESAAGSVSQLREVSARLVDLAKRQNVASILIGHVTKDGALAGPKVLEHLVDTVLSFEGDSSGAFRMVRAAKNRFGPTQEVGIFEMTHAGLREVADPSRLFLAERPQGAAGSVVIPTAEGTRPLVVEVQALVAPATYGAPRRVASGLDPHRLAILLAVLERKAEVQILDHDVFVSVAGGARIDERAADLALALAVVSSLRDREIAPEVVAFGEIGLTGEVRAVQRPGPRLAEVAKLGFRRALLPAANVKQLTAGETQTLEAVPVTTLAQALEVAF